VSVPFNAGRASSSSRLAAAAVAAAASALTSQRRPRPSSTERRDDDVTRATKDDAISGVMHRRRRRRRCRRAGGGGGGGRRGFSDGRTFLLHVASASLLSSSPALAHGSAFPVSWPLSAGRRSCRLIVPRHASIHPQLSVRDVLQRFDDLSRPRRLLPVRKFRCSFPPRHLESLNLLVVVV